MNRGEKNLLLGWPDCGISVFCQYPVQTRFSFMQIFVSHLSVDTHFVFSSTHEEPAAHSCAAGPTGS
jgi:hypothetical protein